MRSVASANTAMAERLYGLAREHAQLTGEENVYDLYSGRCRRRPAQGRALRQDPPPPRKDRGEADRLRLVQPDDPWPGT